MASSRQVADHYSRKARAQGAPARSVFKLEEMDKRWRLFRPGQHVLELGASPGSWTQYASAKVGLSGKVYAYDLKPLTVGTAANVVFRIADVYDLQPEWPHLDVVLSDMAPSTMGHHKTDALRSAALAEHAFGLALDHGKVGSHVVVKVLEGGEVPALGKAMAKAYSKLERLRPQATRRDSTEIFLIGLNKRA